LIQNLARGLRSLFILNKEMKKQTHKRILIIDDDPFIRKIYNERLSADGFDVEEAESGVTGLIKIESGSYDLVLLDIVMSDMTGVDILKKIRSNDKLTNLIVVVLSALGQEDDIKEVLKAGANEYVVKDKTTPRKLVNILEKLISPKL